MLDRLRARLRFRLLRGAVDSALALNRRLEVRKDGLKLVEFSVGLNVKMRARNIHPWDRDMQPEQAMPVFVEQSLSDTESALERLFEACPEVRTIDLRVLEKDSDKTIMAGSVSRAEFVSRHGPSTGMRLRTAGVYYELAGWRFETLDFGEKEGAGASRVGRSSMKTKTRGGGDLTADAPLETWRKSER